MSVTYTNDGQQIITASPYDAGYVATAKGLGGAWHKETRTWRFPASTPEDLIRKALRLAYGADGTNQAGQDLVTIRWNISGRFQYKGSDSATIGPRVVACREYRDSTPTLGRGVILVSGGFAPSGGSHHNRALIPLDGTVLQIADVPRAHVLEHLKAEDVEYIDTTPTIDPAALLTERAALLARLAEIDAALDSVGEAQAPAEVPDAPQVAPVVAAKRCGECGSKSPEPGGWMSASMGLACGPNCYDAMSDDAGYFDTHGHARRRFARS